MRKFKCPACHKTHGDFDGHLMHWDAVHEPEIKKFQKEWEEFMKLQVTSMDFWNNDIDDVWNDFKG